MSITPKMLQISARFTHSILYDLNEQTEEMLYILVWVLEVKDDLYRACRKQKNKIHRVLSAWILSANALACPHDEIWSAKHHPFGIATSYNYCNISKIDWQDRDKERFVCLEGDFLLYTSWVKSYGDRTVRE